jgi:hypothetical protein
MSYADTNKKSAQRARNVARGNCAECNKPREDQSYKQCAKCRAYFADERRKARGIDEIFRAFMLGRSIAELARLYAEPPERIEDVIRRRGRTNRGRMQ